MFFPVILTCFLRYCGGTCANNNKFSKIYIYNWIIFYTFINTFLVYKRTQLDKGACARSRLLALALLKIKICEFDRLGQNTVFLVTHILLTVNYRILSVVNCSVTVRMFVNNTVMKYHKSDKNN